MQKSLYIHIPFCMKKCHYCDFVSYPDLEHMEDAYADALLEEMELYRGESIRTVYMGGGTPTCMDTGQISRILEGVNRCFDTKDCMEISVEANPGTLSASMLGSLKECGVNRLSIGLQSWNPEELELLGRVHGRDEFVENYEKAREMGFDNINIDLIFGIPGQTLNDWSHTLQAVADMAPQHISCYSLKIEESTVFHRMLSEGSITQPDPDLDRDMYHYAVEYLAGRGYKRYEISNFALEGRECVHNLAYWNSRPYIGIGAAAHSYGDGIRKWNTPDVFRYCRLLKEGRPPLEDSETLSAETGMFETIFLKLRTKWGINYRQFEEKFGTDIRLIYKEQLGRLEDGGLIETDGEGFVLTSRGIDLSNIVFVQFII